MSTRPTNVPAIPSVATDNLDEVARAIKMTLDVREGRTGDPLDANVTFRDLVDAQLATDASGNPIGGAGGIPVAPIGSGSDGYNPSLDFTAPPRPENFEANGGLGMILLSWGYPTYRNHAYTEIWRSETNVLGDSVRIGTSDTGFYTDAVGAGTAYYYWIRFVSQANVEGAYNSVNGTLGQASQDPAYLLEVLSGSITESQLYGDLSARINLIDDPESNPNSVNARIAAESVARQTETTAIASVIEQVSTTVGENTATIETQALSIDGLKAQYTVKVDVNGYVTGYGLAADATDGTPTSEFAVRADQFYVAPATNFSQEDTPTATAIGQVWYKPSTKQLYYATTTGTGGWSLQAPNLPFVIRTQPTTINGVSVPSGTYINDAYIANGTITNAKIGDATITSAKIADLGADKITAGTMQVGAYIQSQSYVAGTSGWKISADGSAEFAQSVIRGSIFGGGATGYSSGTSQGFFSGLDGSTYRWRVGNPTGARIQWTGTAIEVYNASNVLTLSSGGVSVSYADITGTKPPIDADKTSLNTAAGIANQGAFATLNQITSSNISTYIASAAIGSAQIGNAAITNAKIGNLEVDSAKIANLTVGTEKITNSAVSQVFVGALGSPTSIFTTTTELYYLPSFTVPTAGRLVVQMVAMFHNFSTGTPYRVQAGMFADGSSLGNNDPILYLNSGSNASAFVGLQPTGSAGGNTATITQLTEFNVFAGQSVPVFVSANASSSNSTVYLTDAFYTAVLYKK